MVTPKHEFVEVDLKLGLAHSVIGANQPLLEVPNRPIGKWHNLLRASAQLRSEWLVASDMLKADLRQTGETLETVRIDGGTERDVLGEERHDRGSLEVGNHAHADSTGSLAALLHCHQDESSSPFLKLSASPQSGLLTDHPCVINLYLAAQGFSSRIHHRSAECEASSTQSRNKTDRV